MIWIFAGVALGLLLVPPRFRKIAFALVGAVFFIFLVVVVLNRRSLPDGRDLPGQKNVPSVASRRFDFDAYEREKKDKEDPEARTRIPTSEVRFDQVGAVPGIDAGTIQSIRARLYNDSTKYTLTDYTYYLLVQDCLPARPDGKSNLQCTTVYDQRGTSSLTVPPNQARDVAISIPKNPANYSLPFKLLGTPRIELTPSETRAYPSSSAPTP